MLEVVAIPILTKAIDFIFGEGSKILEERRERRKAKQEAEKSEAESAATQIIEAQTSNVAQQEVEKPDAESVTTQPATGIETPNVIQSKEDALSIPVDATTWRNSEAEIKHLVSLLEIHTRNYYHAKEQYAKWGSALVPPIVVNSLIEEEDAVATTMKDLQTALSKVCAKKVAIPEIEQV